MSYLKLVLDWNIHQRAGSFSKEKKEGSFLSKQETFFLQKNVGVALWNMVLLVRDLVRTLCQ